MHQLFKLNIIPGNIFTLHLKKVSNKNITLVSAVFTSNRSCM